MNATAIKTTVSNGINQVTESSLMGISATSNIMSRLFSKVEEQSFNKAVTLRSTRKQIRPEAAAYELGESHKHTLENIDLKYAKLKGIFSPKQKQEDRVPDGKVWESKIA